MVEAARGDLVAIMDRWLAGVAAHSADGLPIAADMRFTEQTSEIPVGDGLFLSCTAGPSAFRIDAVDPAAAQIATLALIEMLGQPRLAAIRLKVEGGLIAEAQHLIGDPPTPTGLANLKAPVPAMLVDVPEKQRSPREELARIANSYFDAIEQDDGSLCPFHPDCRRRETGMQTANNPSGPAFPIENPPPALAAGLLRLGAMGPGAQIDTQVMQYITMIRPRQIAVIDEQKGLVFTFPRFVHRADRSEVPVRGIEGLDAMPVGFPPFDLHAAEIFKIEGGLLTEIEAAGFNHVYRARTGWEDRYPETYAYAVTHPATHPYEAGTAS